jgi:hypothetical protein
MDLAQAPGARFALSPARNDANEENHADEELLMAELSMLGRSAPERGTGWPAAYASKATTPAGAIARIRPGRRILIGSGAAEPLELVDALVEHGHHLADNEIVHLLTLGPAPYVRPELAGRFRHSAFFIGPNVRQAVQEGRADFIPVFLSEIPELIRSRRVRIDVALIQTSLPDAHWPATTWILLHASVTSLLSSATHGNGAASAACSSGACWRRHGRTGCRVSPPMF